MKVFRVKIKIYEKSGFSENDLKLAIEKNLNEIDLRLLDFTYQKNSIELPKKLSVCDCRIEYKEFNKQLPYYQLVLGGITSLATNEYPYFDNLSIDPSFEEI